MKKKMFFSFILISIISLIIFGVISLYVIDNSYIDKTKIHLKSLINLTTINIKNNEDYPKTAKDYAEKIGNDVGVTFVDKSGNVLGDSTSQLVFENHSNRKEIIDAFLYGDSSSIRYSDTERKTYIYVAKKINDNTVIRLSVPLMDSIMFIFYSLPAIIFSLLITVLIALFLSSRLSRSLIKPIMDFSEAIDLKVQEENVKSLTFDVKYDELVPIAKRFDELAEDLREYVSKLKFENNKINIILNTMREGLIILDSNKDVLLINSSASKFLGINMDVEGKNILFYTRNATFNNAIETVLNSSELSILNIPEGSISKKSLQFYISPILKNDNKSIIEGILIIISDVTAILRAEKIRSEFVANVSHELKTPITSIKGFAELLSSDSKEDSKNTKDYSEIILSQSERLISLIDDILLLSEVESKTKDSNIQYINLTTIANEIVQVLENQASIKNIKIECSKNDVYFNANRNSIFELLLNLTDNAINYNKIDGKIQLLLEEDEKNVYISVTDTGIGIPKEDINRVFERFYRVDKSRSKKSGGTGLGLSIAKHITELYKGKITIESVLNEYTKIFVVLPKNNNTKSMLSNTNTNFQ
jgi:two-component system phosphate regulon sensor histidine kinase PhoR